MDRKTASLLLRHTLNMRHTENQINLPETPLFGVFTTIYRNDKIHGCMGAFSNSEKAIETKELQQMLMRSLYNAVYKDERRKQFDKPLETDINAQIEWNFLCLPHTRLLVSKLPVNHGILIIKDGTILATFLPNIFPEDTPISKIKEELNNKAENPIKPVEYHIYKTIKVKYGIRSLLMSRAIMKQRVSEFVNKIFNEWKNLNGIPFMRTRGKMSQNPNEYVRNAGLLYILTQCKNNMNNEEKEMLDKQLLKYYQEYKKDPILWRQASIFLALSLPIELSQIIYRNLWKNLPNMESLEKAETVWALAHNVSGYADKIVIPKLSEIDPTDIYTWNWMVQTYSIQNIKTNTKMKLPSIENLNRETNELAVLFEGFSSLLRIFPTNIDILQGQYAIWIELERRIQDGFYAFTDNTCRIDITGHVISGLLYYLN